MRSVRWAEVAHDGTHRSDEQSRVCPGLALSIILTSVWVASCQFLNTKLPTKSQSYSTVMKAHPFDEAWMPSLVSV